MSATPKSGQRSVRRALLSLSDKNGAIDFARALTAMEVEIFSTGGTCRLLREAEIPCREVSDYTDFPEMMGGRIKTLHPKVHGGILGRRGIDDEVMETHGILPFDLVAVNLYPFAETVAKPDCTPAEGVEQIDIGGPAMLRAAAKNHRDVAVVTDPGDYPEVLTALADGGLPEGKRRQLAAKAFAHTAAYDAAVTAWLKSQETGQPAAKPKEHLPPLLHWQLKKQEDLRYGENPHQKAALYREMPPGEEPGAANAQQLQGRPLSYNNLLDADAALECVKLLQGPACVIVKHANPCGAATGDSLQKAYEAAWATDPTSAFGGIIACSQELDRATAEAIMERQFVEVIIAPAVAKETAKALQQKENIRVLITGDWSGRQQGALHAHRITGGLLVQERDTRPAKEEDWRVASQRTPGAAEEADLRFAWHIARFVKSNAIVFAKGGRTLGIGAGQTSRVHSVRIAVMKAADEGLNLKGAAMASDAFFPFRDGVDAAAEAGISAVIQPGGSKRDEEVIAAANEREMAMVLTGARHFRH